MEWENVVSPPRPYMKRYGQMVLWEGLQLHWPSLMKDERYGPSDGLAFDHCL